MDNCGSPHWSTTSAIDELENTHISSSTDSDSDDSSNIRYRLPRRNPSMVQSSTNRTLMDRMAPSNKSIRMKHGKTALDIILPLNRDTSTSLNSASRTQRNPTTSLMRGTVRHNTTTQMNRIPTQNASSVSSFYSPTQRTTQRNPPSSSSRTVSTSYRSQVPIPPPRSRPPAPPYTAPPPYTASSIMSQTSRYHTKSQRPIPPNRNSCTCQPYTTTSSSLIYTSRSSLMTNISQSPVTSIMSQTSSSFVNSSTSSYRPKYPTPTDSTSSFVPSYMSQTSTKSNASQNSTYYQSARSSAPSYRPKYPTPTDSTSSFVPLYMSQTSTTSNASQNSTYYQSTRSSAPSYRPKYPTPTDTTSCSEPIYAPLYFMVPNTSQTSMSSKRSQSTTPSRDIPYSTPLCSSTSSMPIYITPQSSSQTKMFQPFGSIFNLRSHLFHKNPWSCHYNTSPTYSHYTFPRSVHYTMCFSCTYCTVMPRPFTNSYPLSVYEPSNYVWPTEIGDVMQASMQDIWAVLATQLQNALPPSSAVRLQNASGSSTTAHADNNTSLPPDVSRANDQLLKCVDPEPSDSSRTASNSCAGNHNKQAEVKFISLNIPNFEKNDTLYKNMLLELRKAWVYFGYMEVVDIKPDGEIRCICPTLKFENLLHSSINEKLILVNLYRLYKANNLLFETTYDYKSLPRKTIVTENLENTVLKWLTSKKMKEYDWFFNSLSVLEIENINPTNIQKFIMRSKSNKTISLEDQLKICCMIKKVKERPVSLLAISMNLRINRIDRGLLKKIIMPFIEEVFQFPIPSQSYADSNIIKDCNDIILRILFIDIIKLYNTDWVADESIIMTGDLPNNLMKKYLKIIGEHSKARSVPWVVQWYMNMRYDGTTGFLHAPVQCL